MMKQPKSNIHVPNICEQQRPLSPCHCASFVNETTREAPVFKLLLNCDTLAYMYYAENGSGTLVPISFNFQCGDTNVFLNAIFTFVDVFLFFP